MPITANTLKTKVALTWRQFSRKADSEFKVLPPNVTFADYDIDNLWGLDEGVVVRAVQRTYQHVVSNEAISAAKFAREKAKKDGSESTFDIVKFMHDFRMRKRGEWLDGTWGTTRATSTTPVVDDLTAEMQQLMYDKILVLVAKSKPDHGFPSKFDATFASKNSLNGRTVGEMVGAMIAGDATEKGGNVIRTLAQANIDERARKRAEQLAAAETGDVDEMLAAMMATPPAEQPTA